MIACKCQVCHSSDKKDNRLRSSVLLRSASTTIVIDTTPDFRYQMLRASVDHLDAVVFTHSHKDHIAGLDDIRAYNFFSQSPMQLFANEETAHAVKRDFYYAFSEKKYPKSLARQVAQRKPGEISVALCPFSFVFSVVKKHFEITRILECSRS